MKLRILLLSILFMTVFRGGLMAFPSEKTINIESDKITLLAAIERISQEYEVYFTFDMTLVSDVEVEYEDRSYSSAEEAISYILKGTNLKYKFYDHRFVILYKEDDEGLESLRQMSRHLDGLISEGERTMTAAPKREIRAVPRLSSRFISKEIQRVAFTVEGKVVDQVGEPLIGVNIQVKGSNKGTATDFDGNFLLEDIDENAILVITYVGYQSQEISIAGKSKLQIVMASDSQLLDEVVVVGYGTQKKVNLTGAVDQINSEKMERFKPTNIGEALAGHVPNLNINIADGKPGRAASFNIRGTTSINGGSPLVLLDGVPISSFELNNINPQSVENISFLKDASSAAIYGAKAAYGVILIQTKEGKEGEIEINYSNNFKWGKATKIPKVYQGLDYLEIQEREFNGNIGQTYLTEPQVQYLYEVANDPSLPIYDLKNIG